MCVSLIFMAHVLPIFFTRKKGDIIIQWKIIGLIPYMGESLRRATITYPYSTGYSLGLLKWGMVLLKVGEINSAL